MKFTAFVVSLFAAAAVSAALPPVNRPPSQPLPPPSVEFDFSKPVSAAALSVLADGKAAETERFRRDGAVVLAKGQRLRLDAAALPATGTLAVWAELDGVNGGKLIELPFGVDGKNTTVTSGKGDTVPLWLIQVPDVSGKPVQLAGRGAVKAKAPALLAIGFTPDKIQFHFDRALAGAMPARLEKSSDAVLIGGTDGLKIRKIAIYDTLFDHNDILKAYFADPALAWPADAPRAAAKAAPRPKLFADRAVLDEIKAKIATDPVYRARFDRYRARLDQDLVKRIGRKETVGEDKREDGNALAFISLMYAVTGDKTYLDKANGFIDMIVDYAIWDSDKPYWTNFDLVTGHLLIGLSMAYDYLYDDLTPERKAKIREVVRFRADDFARRILIGHWTWATQVLNNHGCVANTGLLTAAAAFDGEIAEAPLWSAASRQWMKGYFAGQPRDGGDFEGLGYMSYSLAHVIMYADLLRKFYGEDIYAVDPALKHNLDCRIESSIPEKYWGLGPGTAGGKRLLTGILSFGDTRQRDFFVPDFFGYKLGAEYKRGDFIDFADRIAKVDNNTVASAYLSLLYFHEAQKSGVKPEAKALPGFIRYPDLDKAFFRSDEPGAESLLIFRCGPPAGHHALKLFNKVQGEGHVHPDVGGITLFAAGEIMIINSDYSHKLTGQENTLLVNGVGQHGNDTRWGEYSAYWRDKLDPAIIHTESNADFDYVVGDAAPAYLPAAELKTFKRHIWRFKPDLYVVADEVEAGKPSTFESRFHSLNSIELESGKYAKMAGKNGSLHFRNLLPADGVFAKSVNNVILIDGGAPPRPTNLLTLRNGEPATKTLFVTVLAPGSAQYRAEVKDGMLSLEYRGKTHFVKLP